MYRHFRTHLPGTPRPYGKFRPGIMLGGRVIMAPSRADGTKKLSHHGFIRGVHVFLNGGEVFNALGYDEADGEVLVRHGGIPQLIKGTVRAVPRG